MMLMSAESLALACHGACLREMAAASGQQHQGLQAAARAYRQLLGPRLERRLIHLDSACDLLRRITAVSVDELLSSVARMRKRDSPLNNGSLGCWHEQYADHPRQRRHSRRGGGF